MSTFTVTPAVVSYVAPFAFALAFLIQPLVIAPLWRHTHRQPRTTRRITRRTSRGRGR